MWFIATTSNLQKSTTTRNWFLCNMNTMCWRSDGNNDRQMIWNQRNILTRTAAVFFATHSFIIFYLLLKHCRCSYFLIFLFFIWNQTDFTVFNRLKIQMIYTKFMKIQLPRPNKKKCTTRSWRHSSTDTSANDVLFLFNKWKRNCFPSFSNRSSRKARRLIFLR